MAEPYRPFSSAVIPLLVDNVDTDQIIPARYLTTTERTGLADGLFRDWRVREDGTPDPDFVLNRPEMAGRRILLVGANFGSGSSREHASWALASWGIRAIVGRSFADIFRNNALKNGLLPIALETEAHARVVALVAADPGAQLNVDLEAGVIRLPDGAPVGFEIDRFARQMLLDGTDEIGWMLKRGAAIAAYEAAHPPRVDTRP